MQAKTILRLWQCKKAENLHQCSFICFVTAFFFPEEVCSFPDSVMGSETTTQNNLGVCADLLHSYYPKKNQVKHANIISDGATKDDKCSRECRRWWF